MPLVRLLGLDKAHLQIVGMDEVDDRARAELFDRESKCFLPGGIQVLEVAVEIRRGNQVERKGVMAFKSRLQGAALVDEPPQKATEARYALPVAKRIATLGSFATVAS